MDYKNLPKVELHCHLDGSIRLETMIMLAKKDKISLPTYDLKKLKTLYKNMGKKALPKLHKQKFQMAIDVMSNAQNLSLVINELIEDACNENVIYLEIRFAPRLHVRENFPIEEVIKTFSNTLQEANKNLDIIVNGIICFRSTDNKDGINDVLEIASKYLGKRIVGVDLVGIETADFAYNFIKHIAYAKRLGFKVTIHSGEMIKSKNVKNAINLLKTDRIGHGFTIAGDKEQVDLVLKHNTPIEICLTSNVKRLDFNYLRHPFKKFLDLGMNLSLNTDNRTLSNTNLTKEIKVAFEVFKITKKQYYKILKDSINASFANDEEKKQLINKIFY